jgi:hypothetical protein
MEVQEEEQEPSQRSRDLNQKMLLYYTREVGKQTLSIDLRKKQCLK